MQRFLTLITILINLIKNVSFSDSPTAHQHFERLLTLIGVGLYKDYTLHSQPSNYTNSIIPVQYISTNNRKELCKRVEFCDELAE